MRYTQRRPNLKYPAVRQAEGMFRAEHCMLLLFFCFVHYPLFTWYFEYALEDAMSLANNYYDIGYRHAIRQFAF